MEYIRLKNSDLKVSRLCMGGCPMGGYGWGNTQEDELIGAVRSALENGITFFDTADTYGLGQSEKTLGKALGGDRNKISVATKFGVRVENGKTFYDNSPEWIEKACAESMKRLNTDYIDLYQVHYRDGITPISEVLESLDKLKRKGYIRYFGLSNIHAGDMQELKDYTGKFISFQDEYSLACRKNEEDMLTISRELSMNPLTWGSLGQGILTGKYDINSKFESNDRRNRDVYVNFHGEKLKKNLDIVEAMRPIAKAHNVSVAAVAIRFILDYLPQSVVLVGAKRPSQIESNAQAVGWTLTGDELDILNKVSN